MVATIDHLVHYGDKKEGSRIVSA